MFTCWSYIKSAAHGGQANKIEKTKTLPHKCDIAIDIGSRFCVKEEEEEEGEEEEEEEEEKEVNNNVNNEREKKKRKKMGEKKEKKSIKNPDYIIFSYFIL